MGDFKLKKKKSRSSGAAYLKKQGLAKDFIRGGKRRMTE